MTCWLREFRKIAGLGGGGAAEVFNVVLMPIAYESVDALLSRRFRCSAIAKRAFRRNPATTDVGFSLGYFVGEREAPRDRMLTRFCEETRSGVGPPIPALRETKNVVLAMLQSKLSVSFWWGGLTAGAGRVGCYDQ